MTTLKELIKDFAYELTTIEQEIVEQQEQTLDDDLKTVEEIREDIIEEKLSVLMARIKGRLIG